MHLLIIAALLALSACAQAQEHDLYDMGHGVYVSEAGYIALVDEITEGTDDAFLKALTVVPHTSLIILDDNIGGLIYEAQTIGLMIRELGLHTHISNHCLSACVDIFVAGSRRTMDAGGVIGVHAPSEVNAEAIREDKWYFAKMGTPQMMQLTYSVPNSSMEYYGLSDAVSLGLSHGRM
jgi:hypothetical protein